MWINLQISLLNFDIYYIIYVIIIGDNMKKQKKDIVEKLSKKIEENKTKVKTKKEQENLNAKNDKQSLFSKILNNKNVKKAIGVIEAIIYIVCIIAVIFANVYAPIYIHMIPLLFILGIVGKLAYDRPIITTVFGFLVSICAVYTSGVKNIPQNLLISAVMAMYIALGELCAFSFKKSYEYLKKKSKRISKRGVFTYCICIIIFFVSIGLYNYTNSNYFVFKKNSQRLNEYLNTNYNDKEFEIVDAKYNFIGQKSFVYEVKDKNVGRSYKFIVSLDEKYQIDDGYIKFQNANREKKANEKLITYFKNNNLKEKYPNIKIGVLLNEVDNLELEILKEVEDVTDENTLEFSKQVAGVLNDIKYFEYFNEFEQIIINLKDKQNVTESLISYLFIERYLDNESLDITKDYDYIYQSLNVEYID